MKNGAQQSANNPGISARGEMVRQLRNLGYRIELPNPQASQAQA